MIKPVEYLLDQFKKGIATSEFWLLTLALVYNAATGAIDPSRPISEQIPGIAVAVGAAAWAALRTWLKRHRAQILAGTVIDAMVAEANKLPPSYIQPLDLGPTVVPTA